MIQFARCEVQGQSMFLPLRNGKALCSFRNPTVEAERWLKNIGKIKCPVVYVIGLGAGFHVSALRTQFEGKIRVIEIDSYLIEKFCELNSTQNIEFLALGEQSEQLKLWMNESHSEQQEIFDFRPSWIDCEQSYSQVRALLTGRSPEAVTHLKAQFGFRSVDADRLPTDRLLTAKEIAIALEPTRFNEEHKIWLCLQELLK